VIRKHLANVGYSDIVLAAGPGMSHGWIQSLAALQFRGRDGALVTLDAYSRERLRLLFFRALIIARPWPSSPRGIEPRGASPPANGSVIAFASKRGETPWRPQRARPSGPA
jgi:hypothetical protein